MRRMSFSMTEPQFRDGSKDVTRRLGWKFLKPGDRIMGVRKCMGLAKGEKQDETVELSVTGAPGATPVQDTVRVLLGPALPGAVLPKVSPPPEDAVSFLQVNQKPDTYRAATALSMSFNPALHMPDEDTFMENLTALSAQVASVRALAPQARIAVGPLVFDSPYPRAAPDPRHQGRFAAAWAAAALLELTGAGVPEVSLKLGPAAQPVLAAFAQQTGSALLQTRRFGTSPLPVRAQAVLVQGERVLWLVNETPDQRTVLVGGLQGMTQARLRRFIGENPPAGPVEGTAGVTHEVLRLELAPYEVCEVNLGKQP